jgi:ABC-2 type transport system permease protein
VRPTLLASTLRDRRRWLIGWSLGITSYVVLILAFYPSLKDQGHSFDQALGKMPESMKALFGMGGGIDLFSPVGYLSSQLYSLMLPLLLLVAGIGFGAGLAGDEEHGLLEMTLGAPVTRTRVALERFAAVTAGLGVLAVASWASVAVAARAVSLDISTGALFWATLSVTLLTMAGASISLAVGAVTGRRSIAIATTSVFLVASYLVTSLATAGISFFTHLTPYSVFTLTDVVPTLQRGTPAIGLVWLVALTAIGAGVAVWGFNRRDIRG